MSAMRVHELAKEFGMTSKELLDRLQAMKIPAKNHASTLVDAYVDKIRKELGPEIAERQAAIEAERAAEEAAEAAAKAEEEARRKADEEARRKAEEAERKAREEERRAREEEQRRLEEEARKRAEEEQAAREEAETADARGVIEAAAAAPVVEPAPVVEAAPAPVAEVPVVEEAPAPTKPAGKMSALEAAIAAEAARLESEKAAAKAVEQEKIEEQRYRDMAREAEALQRDRVIEEAKAAVAQAQAEGGRKKKKKHKKTGEENVEAHLHDEATHVDLPCGGDSVTVTEGATVGEFADLLGVPANDVIKRLFLLGTPLTVNQPMMRDMLEIIGEDMGREIRVVKPEEETGWTFEDKAEDLKPRPPVVTVMGHVDHGKTSLLDAIRETGVAATEAGGITQHIGASVVHKNGRQITFIDTPGHEAFTAMRARGANITDIVILVVAADDGVMPQTVEAIHHAKAAGVPIIVAVNKIDKDGANPETVKQMLTEHEIVPEEWGGTNIFVNVSAKKRINIEDLLEMVLLQADVLELTANPDAHASGVVIEANLDKGRGPVATVLVQRGTLRVGDTLVAGTTYGRVRALIDPLGKTVDSAGPADPVEILGLNAVPSAGDEFRVFADERDARNLAEDRALKQRLVAQAKTKKHVSLDDLFDRIAEGELKDLNLVVKADVQGSIEALKDALDKMDQTEVRINVIHNGVGGITESDVMLADASDAIIIGFNVRPVPGAKQLAEKENVDIRTYRVIYQAIEEINAARVGLLSPDIVEQETAHIEVRELFRVPKVGVIAGCYVMDGEISRDDQVRIVRDGTVIYEGKMASLRRFKEDVKTVKSGYECGIGVEGYQDLKEGDIIEGFKTIEVAREA